jgi:Tfp pilus assembly protein PilN
MQSSASINLLKGRVNWLDQALKWALSVGRLLIIIVEFLAFGTFVLRFSLDRTLIDLGDKIKQEQAIVASLKDREETYRNLQERLMVASTVSDQADTNVKIVQDVFDMTPPEIKYDNFLIQGGRITIQAKVHSTPALSSFLSSLRNYENISSVSVDSIGNKTSDGALTVGITALLKNTKSGI